MLASLLLVCGLGATACTAHHTTQASDGPPAPSGAFALAAFSSCPSWADRLLSSHLVDDLADGGEHALVLGRDSLADTSIDVGERERHDIEPALAWLRKL